MLRYAVLSSLVWSAAAGAQQAPEPAPVPEPPQIPSEVPQGPAIEPEVTIIREEGRVIEEYRINGQLYKVKVTPTRGKPYYLLYPQGEGAEPIRREIEDLQTPYWLIFSW